MAHETIVYGAIVGTPLRTPLHTPEARNLQQLNIDTLNAMPSSSDWPALCRSAFSVTTQPSFRSQVIHFGASYNGLHFDEVPRWVEKFEALLTTLYWSHATAHIWTDYIDGIYQFLWQTDQDLIALSGTQKPQPSSIWHRSVLHLERSSEGLPSKPFGG